MSLQIYPASRLLSLAGILEHSRYTEIHRPIIVQYFRPICLLGTEPV